MTSGLDLGHHLSARSWEYLEPWGSYLPTLFYGCTNVDRGLYLPIARSTCTCTDFYPLYLSGHEISQIGVPLQMVFLVVPLLPRDTNLRGSGIRGALGPVLPFSRDHWSDGLCDVYK